MVRNHAALLRFIAERRDMPFVWGSAANDCASFAAAAVRAQGGGDPLADLHWTDEAEAYRVIEAEGSLAEAVSKRLREVPLAMAMRGDVAGVMRENQLGLMIVLGTTLVGPGEHGLIQRPRRDMVQAWSAL